MQDINKRLDSIEDRLFAIEEKLGLLRNPAAVRGQTAPPADSPPDAAAPVAGPTRTPPSEGAAMNTAATPAEQPQNFATVTPRSTTAGPSMSNLMAVGAALSFLLAAAYFVVLAMEHGWLTPSRQLVIAAGFGTSLIAAGVLLSVRDRSYAAYLPAAGMGVLYIAVYAGHLWYELIPPVAAFIAVAGVSLLGLALGRRFDHSIYAVLAALGVYLTPILVPVAHTDLIGIVVYFTAWSLLFSFLSLQEGRRASYLVALYLALLCFDAAWRIAGAPNWPLASAYQLAQFIIFVFTAIAFSIKHQRPMAQSDALLHGLPLFYFYLIEYVMLERHAPDLVVVAGFGSVIVVVAAFLFARRRIEDPDAMSAAAALVSTYASIVTSHMVFGKLLPADYFAWGALVLPALGFFVARQRRWGRAVSTPLFLVGGLIFAAGFGQSVLFERGAAAPAASNTILVLYAFALYAAYFIVRRDKTQSGFGAVALFLGHFALMVASVRIMDSGLAISFIWAVYAVALLLLALKLGDKNIGQSSLLIFAASALKVLLFDLAGSGSMVRIISLVILGASLYAGGWLYQNLVRNSD